MKPNNETPEFNELAAFLRDIREPFDKIWLRFWDWKLMHPEVEAQLYALSLQAQQGGLARYGIGAIWEVLRWHLRVVNGKTEEFRCSNDYRSRFARYLMWKYPALRGFFETRPLRVENAEAMELVPTEGGK